MSKGRLSVPTWHTWSRDLTVLSAHPWVYHEQINYTCLCAFPAKAGPHLPTPEGWKLVMKTDQDHSDIAAAARCAVVRSRTVTY